MKTVAPSLFGRLWRRHVAVARQTLQPDSGKIGPMKNAPPVGVRVCVFDASNAWDAYAASPFGMGVVWCNRYRQRPERLPGKPQNEVRSQAELPALLGVPSGR
jgi:hypothetical protein